MEYNTKERQDTIDDAIVLNVVYNDKAKCFEIYTNSSIDLFNVKGVLKID